jgi:hypothetical protein
MIILLSIKLWIKCELFFNFRIKSITKLRYKRVFIWSKILLLQLWFWNEFYIFFRLLIRIVSILLLKNLRRSCTYKSNWITFPINLIIFEQNITYILTQNICIFLAAHYTLLIKNHFISLRHWIFPLFELVLIMLEYRILRLVLWYFIRLIIHL